MLVQMTLTLMQGHSGSAKAKTQRCMLSATKQLSIKLATTVGHFLLDLDLANVNMACPSRFPFRKMEDRSLEGGKKYWSCHMKEIQCGEDCQRSVTAAGMRMHHVLIILTLTFIQGHTYLNGEHYKCWIISEPVQVMPIKLAVNIVRR